LLETKKTIHNTKHYIKHVRKIKLLKRNKTLPELGLGVNLIDGPELHSVDLRVLIWFHGKSPPNHLVLVKLQTHITKHHLVKIINREK